MLRGVPGEAVPGDALEVGLHLFVAAGHALEKVVPQRALPSGWDSGFLRQVIFGARRVAFARSRSTVIRISPVLRRSGSASHWSAVAASRR